MVKYLSASGLLATLLASTAVAADLPLRGSAPAPVFTQAANWTGYYLGAHVAYHNGKINDRGCVGLCIVGHRIQDPYLAIQGGADYQFANNVVLGAFAWAAVTRVHSSAELLPGVSIKGRSELGGMVGARVGYAFGDFLPYVFAGYELFRDRVTIAISPIPVNRRTHHGYGVGAGVEYAIAQNWSVDLRYMYSDLGREDYNFGGGVTSAGERAHTVSLGLNYRFSQRTSAVVARY